MICFSNGLALVIMTVLIHHSPVYAGDAELQLSALATANKDLLGLEKMELMTKVKNMEESNDKLMSELQSLNRDDILRSQNTSAQTLYGDCTDLLRAGFKTSGAYWIYPESCGCHKAMRVWCDQVTDGGGWTVLLWRKKQRKQEDFNRDWTHYRNGFGLPNAEHFLGLESAYILTHSRGQSMRMDVTTTGGENLHVKYNEILIHGEANKYKLELNGYDTSPGSSNMGYNCFLYNRNRYFSTRDSDNDQHSSTNCALSRKGGFWYYYCYVYSSNSYYTDYPPTGTYATYLNVSCYKDFKVTELQMKIRPAICETSVKKIDALQYGCDGECEEHAV